MSEEKGPYVVRGLRLEAAGVLSVELVPADGRPVPEWAPGAHVDLVVGDGTSRQYSLCGSPGAASLRVAVLRRGDGRGGSRWVHDHLRPGQTVLVGGPRNHFVLERAERYVFVAGGVGITPLLPMLARAEAEGAQWALHYFGRSLSTMAFVEELAAYGHKVRLHPADAGPRPEPAALLAGTTSTTLVYACGPQRLLDAVGKAAAEVGAEERLRTELFTAPVTTSPDTPDAGSFDVRLEATGVDVHVPADRSLLSALAEAGIDVMSDCEEGICGSCETRVLDGVVEHRDHVLTPQERAVGDCMMVCVSRAASPRLTLDL